MTGSGSTPSEPGRESALRPVDVYVESGTKRTFVGAIDWPGWCRAGRDEATACEALLDHEARYRSVLDDAGIDFPAGPDSTVPTQLRVEQRLAGTPTTDFGAPDGSPEDDERPVSETDLSRLRGILEACWAAVDRARAGAPAELRKGPRGGGRDREAIYDHVLDAEAAYLSRLGGKAAVSAPWSPERVTLERAGMIAGLEAAARGQVPIAGPRGGRRWSARYFVRRVAWHALDHAWEIEDRS